MNSRNSKLLILVSTQIFLMECCFCLLLFIKSLNGFVLTHLHSYMCRHYSYYSLRSQDVLHIFVPRMPTQTLRVFRCAAAWSWTELQQKDLRRPELNTLEGFQSILKDHESSVEHCTRFWIFYQPKHCKLFLPAACSGVEVIFIPNYSVWLLLAPALFCCSPGHILKKRF